MLSRRSLLRLLALPALAAATPVSALSRASSGDAPRDLAEQLVADLTRAYAEVDAAQSFRVLRFDHADEGGEVGLAADLRLDWRPGYRTQRVVGEGSDDAEAYAALVSGAREAFDLAFFPKGRGE